MSEDYKSAGAKGFFSGVAIGFGIGSFSLLIFAIISSLFLGPAIGIFLGVISFVGCCLVVPILGAMQIIGPCPYCNRRIGVGQLRGFKAMPGGAFDCPHCKNRILVTKHSHRYVKPGEPDDEESFSRGDEPGDLTDKISAERTKKCPLCAETIKFEAKKCRFCNHLFDVEKVEGQTEELKPQETLVRDYA